MDQLQQQIDQLNQLNRLLLVELENLGISDHSDDEYDTESDTDSEWWSEPEDDDPDTPSEPEEVEILPPPGFRERPLNPNDIPAMHGTHGGFAQDLVVPEEPPRAEVSVHLCIYYSKELLQNETDTEDEDE